MNPWQREDQGVRQREEQGVQPPWKAQLLGGGVDSPYVVRLYEYVEAPQGAAIVMELVDGVALRALLRREGATGPEAALAVLKGSLLGPAAAHGAGVVHRDREPENVLVAADGSSKHRNAPLAASRRETGPLVEFRTCGVDPPFVDPPAGPPGRCARVATSNL